jgi:hypothetical protein
MERDFTLESVPAEPTSSVWEGTLSPRPDIDPDVSKGVLGRKLDLESLQNDPPRITIGQPEVLRSLRAVAPEGFEHVEPRDFYLVRLWCSFLSFRTDLVFDHAHFQVTLAAPGTDTTTVVAHDLYPSEVMYKVKRNVKFSLSPELKFAELGGGVGGVEYGFEYDELQPSIVAAGQGQATPSWVFAATKGSRLLGGKAVHMVVAAPAGTPSAEAALELIVHVTKPGLIPLPMGILDAKGQVPAEPLTVTLW